MNWREFLKPGWKKNMIFIVLVLMTFVPINAIFITSSGTFGTYHGFPFIFYAAGNGILEFNYFHLILDLILFYLLSCISVFAYDRFKSRNK